MYQIEDRVVYGCHGACRIVDVEERSIDRKVISYFALEPIGQPGVRFLVPSQNPTALAKLRPLIGRQELEELLHSEQVRSDCWIPDENRRKQRYRELIGSGDIAALVSMVHTLHLHKQQLQETGKRAHQCDENFLHDAQKLLAGEFAIVLDIPPSEVAEYVQNSIG